MLCRFGLVFVLAYDVLPFLAVFHPNLVFVNLFQLTQH